MLIEDARLGQQLPEFPKCARWRVERGTKLVPFVRGEVEVSLVRENLLGRAERLLHHERSQGRLFEFCCTGETLSIPSAVRN